MKKTVIGVFSNRKDAEKAINYLHSKLSIPNDDISYLYRNTDDEVQEVNTKNVSSKTVAEGAKKGAVGGATVGALAGIAAVAGVIPVIGPFFAAGPLLAVLGVTGAVGTAAAGAVGGAVLGGIIGGLINLGVGKERAQLYEDEVMAGNILVVVQAEDNDMVEKVLMDYEATDVESYTVTV